MNQQGFASENAIQNSDSSKNISPTFVSLSTLNNSYRGQLIYADDSLFVIWLSETKYDFQRDQHFVKIFKPEELVRLRIESNQNSLLKILPGTLIGYAIGFSLVMAIGSNQNYNPGVGSAPIPHDQLIRTSLMGGFPIAVLGGLTNALINNFNSREIYVSPKSYKSILSDLKDHAQFPDELPQQIITTWKNHSQNKQ